MTPCRQSGRCRGGSSTRPSARGSRPSLPNHSCYPPVMSYAAIAREKAEIVERTGLLGEGDAGRQIVARFFLLGFATPEQRERWLPRVAVVAISEPRVGAHPKLLNTRAEEDADGYR